MSTKTLPIITLGIAGGTGAGKSTLARRIYEELGGDENVSYLLHDSYYKDITHLSLEQRSQTNFDHPASLDTDLLVEHIQCLKRGQACQVPTYDFATHSRTDVTVERQPKPIILVEGILIFCHPGLVSELDLRVYVDSDPDIRFTRRLRRDVKERGRTVDDVIQQYHDTVRPMHEAYVEPCKRLADIIIPSYHAAPARAIVKGSGEDGGDRLEKKDDNNCAGDDNGPMKVAVEIICNHVKCRIGML